LSIYSGYFGVGVLNYLPLPWLILNLVPPDFNLSSRIIGMSHWHLAPFSENNSHEPGAGGACL
jgi:hypothetical protein